METDPLGKLLLSSKFLSEEEIASLQEWWSVSRHESESLVDFFARQMIVGRDVVRAVGAVNKGFLTSDTLFTYLTPTLCQAIRKKVEQFKKPEIRTVQAGSSVAALAENIDLSDSFAELVYEDSTPQLTKTILPSSVDPFATSEPASGVESKNSSSNESFEIQETVQRKDGSTAQELFPSSNSKWSKQDDVLERTFLTPDITRVNRRSDSFERILSPEQEVKTGMLLGKCLLIEEVGSGATGRVFRAKHQTLDISVAVKILNTNSEGFSERQLDLFRSEARLLAQLNHPHVIRIFDLEEEPFPYLVLEYVEGCTLNDLIQQSGSIRWDRALSMVHEAALGLACAWKMNIVHRDVKPANILVSKSGVAKIADLGLAIFRPKKADASKNQEPVGTMAYMSPEQAMHPGTIDHRSDIYSLGATLYHAVTGQKVFPARKMADAILKLMKDQPIPPQKHLPSLDAQANDLIMRMIAKDRAQRFNTYEDLIREMKKWLPDSRDVSAKSLGGLTHNPGSIHRSRG